MINFYFQLEKHISKINQIRAASAVLHWDLTQNTPDGAKDTMSQDIGNLDALAHEMFISKKTEDLIEGAAALLLNDWEKANLALIKKEYITSIALSTEFVEKFSTLTSKAQDIWQKAKLSSDWDTFSPYLVQIVEEVKEMAKIKSIKLSVSPYEALLDQYDSGRKVSEIESVFSLLKKELPPLIDQIIDKQKTELVLPITQQIEPQLQREISLKIMSKMGFDFTKGRLDEYEHPFCITTSGGVRILSKFMPEDMLNGIMATIHETGHALYEQNLPQKYKNLPVGQACGMSVHESQSLFMELQMARSRGFSEYLAELLSDEFGLKAPEFGADNLYKLLNRVKPDLIRIHADEVTYPLHVILRFEIEKALLDGDIKVDELPHIWNEKMKQYLGIVPNNHKDGCMQDVHWSSGGFGYFPCYVGGSINASILAKSAKEKGFFKEEDIKNGDLSSISSFLKENIWNKGSCFTPSKLIENATSVSSLDGNIFLSYLKSKFQVH